MRILIFALLFSFNSFASVMVISDLDDTIKITDAGDLRNAAWNGFFTEKVFAGIPEFLKNTRKYTDSLHVVSAGPRLIKSRVKALLKKHQIQHDGIYLRKIPGKEGKLDFKVRAISEILEKNPGDVILMGDDVDLDPEIYSEISRKYSSRILGVYIHVVKGRNIPSEFTKYWTSFDLALKEHMAGRMDSESVLNVAKPLLSEAKLSMIIPKFASCPTSSVVWDWQLATMFSVEATALTQKLNEFCHRGAKSKPF